MSQNSDAEFQKTFLMVLAVLVGLALLALSAALWLTGGPEDNPLFAEEVVAERIAAVGQVRLLGDGDIAPSSTVVIAAAPRAGKEIVAAACAACHQTGVINSPKIGDQAAWNARMGNGLEAIVATAIQGKGAMPAKGGCSDCSDDEIYNAVVVMLRDSGIDAGAEKTGSADISSAPQAATSASAVIATATPVAATATDGEQTYNTFCVACHSGVMPTAPKPGSAAWKPRLEAKGREGLYASGVNGLLPLMPPRGSCMNCSDADIHAVVDYMLQGVE